MHRLNLCALLIAATFSATSSALPIAEIGGNVQIRGGTGGIFDIDWLDSSKTIDSTIVQRAYQTPDGPQAGTAAAYAAASASLAAGKIQAISVSSITLCPSCVGVAQVSAQSLARAELKGEVVTFRKANPATSPWTVTIGADLTTGLSSDPFVGDAKYSQNISLTPNFDASQAVTISEQLSPSDNLSSYIFNFVVPETLDSFSLSLAAFGQAEAVARTNGSIVLSVSDFGSSLSFSMALPEDVTYTSLSGLWLTERPGAVTTRTDGASIPEPATLLLFSLGLAALGFSSRKQT